MRVATGPARDDTSSMTSQLREPLYGLLLDVDGPIASPVTRTLAIDSIAADLVAMARAGVPLVFNTGRSDVFVARTVMPSLVAAGLPDDAVVLAVCEKGSTWFVPKPEHLDGAGDDLEVDDDEGRLRQGGAQVEDVLHHLHADDRRRGGRQRHGPTPGRTGRRRSHVPSRWSDARSSGVVGGRP